MTGGASLRYRGGTTRRAFLRSAFSGSAALLAACSPLEVLNHLVPASTYRASNGLAYGPHARNQLDVYAPAAVGDAPVVVFFYGGNWHGGARADYLFAGEALASKGFVAVIPDYRLYPEVRFPAFLQDCAQAAGWTLRRISQFGGDPQRVFVMGHSAGAYNAAMVALAPEYLRLAGVAPPRIRGLIGLAGPYDFLPLQTSQNKAVFGFPDTPVATQPIHFASAAAPPSLLVTGDDDRTVDPGNSRRLGARLREKGAQVHEIVYPGVSHRALLGALAAPLRPLAPVLDDVAAFVRQA